MNINNQIPPIDQNQMLFQNEADILNAMSHPARLEILELLRDGESCVCHIQAMLDHRQAYISQQLNILRQAGLITSRKAGLRVYYKISDPSLFDLLDQVKGILLKLGKWQPDASEQDDLLQKKKACHCPQCAPQTEKEISEPAKVEYA
jgi:DNA-binding transcriptional ArsR family regulator